MNSVGFKLDGKVIAYATLSSHIPPVGTKLYVGQFTLYVKEVISHLDTHEIPDPLMPTGTVSYTVHLSKKPPRPSLGFGWDTALIIFTQVLVMALATVHHWR